MLPLSSSPSSSSLWEERWSPQEPPGRSWNLLLRDPGLFHLLPSLSRQPPSGGNRLDSSEVLHGTRTSNQPTRGGRGKTRLGLLTPTPVHLPYPTPPSRAEALSGGWKVASPGPTEGRSEARGSFSVSAQFRYQASLCAGLTYPVDTVGPTEVF